MTPEEVRRFEEAKRKIIGIDRLRPGIGTYGEKTVHAIFKSYYEPDEDRHEIPIGRYIADIFTGEEIVEIQTRDFNRMRDKLSVFLEEYPVTLVYPIPRIKWLIWIDEESGELTARRKSPKKGNFYLAFKELYRIKMHLRHPNLRLKLVLVDMEEYRLLNGWSKDRKKGSSRYDRIPLSLEEEVTLQCREDYSLFVPPELDEPFTSKEFGKAAHIPMSLAQVALHILHELEVVERVGKKGNSFLYTYCGTE